MEAWACPNNLQLNRSKCVEIVFSGNKRSRRDPLPPPPPLPDICRVTSVKILGVTVSSKLSVSSCAQTLHALRLLRAHGLCDVALQIVYRAVVVSRLLYAASAWWGFATIRGPAAHPGVFTSRCARRLSSRGRTHGSSACWRP